MSRKDPRILRNVLDHPFGFFLWHIHDRPDKIRHFFRMKTFFHFFQLFKG